MNNVRHHLLDDFIQACHMAARYGLIQCSSGNMSQRLDDEHFLVSTSHSWMDRMAADQITTCRISDGTSLDNKNPTIEVGFHAGILRNRDDVNVVMHYQSPFATTLACHKRNNLNYNVIPEIPYYLGPIAKIPYILPGSGELAEAVVANMQEHDMVIMGNHGQVTVARDFNQVIQNAAFFELACEIIVRGGSSVTPLDETSINELLTMRQAI
jgi:ribulose-5-phosphate 4-epimerase/fuculose-1-phosphate aldolase